jgi:hypothetical protein
LTITIGIDDDAHEAILTKQSEIYLKTKKRVRITDLATEAILAGIDLIRNNYIR